MMGGRMKTTTRTTTPEEVRLRVEGLAADLAPGTNRARVYGELERMFRSGSPPEPLPDGFYRGRLLATTTRAPVDAVVRELASMWMPWQGKAFDADAATGTNRFRQDVRAPMRVVWPSYEPVAAAGGGLEAFVFRTRIAPGALDPDLRVLKIDYDFPFNPGFVIRRILDEVVQVADGVYLGKVLMRARGRFHRVGFFLLSA